MAPITRTSRRIPTEVAVGPSNGLPVESAASFDNIQQIRRSFLTERVSQHGADQAAELCRALRALAG